MAQSCYGPWICDVRFWYMNRILVMTEMRREAVMSGYTLKCELHGLPAA